MGKLTMNVAAKYLLVLAIVVSALTSIATTAVLNLDNKEETNESQGEPAAENVNKTKVNFQLTELRFDANFVSIVKVYVGQPVDNLTIVYEYTCLNGTVLTTSVDYGSVQPAWDNSIIYPGGERILSSLQFSIPKEIILASSSLESGAMEGVIWDVQPQVNVIEIYGYK